VADRSAARRTARPETSVRVPFDGIQRRYRDAHDPAMAPRSPQTRPRPPAPIERGESHVPIVAVSCPPDAHEELGAFLGALPRDFGPAVVVATFGSPSAPLRAILSLHAVTSATSGDLRRGQVYLVGASDGATEASSPAPALETRLVGNTLLSAPSSVSGAPTVDAFLRAVAAQRGPDSVAVLLPGVVPTGLAGARAILSAGGVVLTQPGTVPAAWGDGVVEASPWAMPSVLARRTDAEAPPPPSDPVPAADPSRTGRIEALERELASARASLREVVGQLGARDDQLSAANAELRLAHQRLRDLDGATRDLDRERVEAESAARAKDQFLANLNHEVRSPMAAIVGYAEILLATDVDAADREVAGEAIRRNGERLMRLINDMLDLSRIDDGSLAIESTPCAPWSVLAEVAATCRVLAAQKGLDLRLAADGPVPADLVTDPMRLRQILLNLAGNAVKFTPAGGHVDLGLSVRPSPRALVFTVTDDGEGIAPEVMSRLFRPFEQADASATRRHDGPGLGLSVSDRLARALGGRVEAESAPGRGSTFRLVVPLPDDAVLVAVPGEPSGPPVPDAAAGPRTLGAGRVLVVDDSADLRSMMVLWLRREGLDVTTAEDGRGGLERALATPFDVILMDIQMPAMDGHTATAALRGAGYRGPIIGVSAHATPEDRRRHLASGMDDVLAKPLDRQALLAALGRHLPADREG